MLKHEERENALFNEQIEVRGNDYLNSLKSWIKHWQLLQECHKKRLLEVIRDNITEFENLIATSDVKF
jgi:hypothetical protein